MTKEKSHKSSLKKKTKKSCFDVTALK